MRRALLAFVADIYDTVPLPSNLSFAFFSLESKLYLDGSLHGIAHGICIPAGIFLVLFDRLLRKGSKHANRGISAFLRTD